MPKPPTPAQWRAFVLRTPAVSDSVRVLLLLMGESMRSNLTVSVPAAQLAEALGRSTKTVERRIQLARQAGLLDTVVRGQKGVTAVYQGLFSPSPSMGLSHLEVKGLNRADSAFSPSYGCRTTTTADPSRRGADRDVGSEEKRRDQMPFDRGHERAEDESRRSA